MEKISKDILIGLLKSRRQHVEPIYTSAEDIRARVSFNKALEDIGDFIEDYTKGKIVKEYVDSLIEKAQEK